MMTKAEQRVYDHLKEHAVDNVANPSIQELADQMGYAENKSVTAYIKKLEQKGHIEVIRPKTNGKGKRNKYILKGE